MISGDFHLFWTVREWFQDEIGFLFAKIQKTEKKDNSANKRTKGFGVEKKDNPFKKRTYDKPE